LQYSSAVKKKSKLVLTRHAVMRLDPKRLREVQGGQAESDPNDPIDPFPPTSDVTIVCSRLLCW
jgi:hypothetical protein